jgi:MFS family permease
MVSKYTTGARQFNWINVGMVLAMSFASITVGYSASIIATTLAQPTFLAYFDLETRPDATALISTMNGLYYVGGFLGVFTVSWFAERWGRKAAIFVSVVITLISGALLAGSVDVAMFIVFRFFTGAGAFMALSAVPVWMSEVTPPKNRGSLVDIHAVGVLIGYVMASWIGYGFYFLQSPSAWRAPLGKLIHQTHLSTCKARQADIEKHLEASRPS